MYEPSPDSTYFDITVSKPFTAVNVIFLPGHTYRVRQTVLDGIKADSASAACIASESLVPDYVPVS
jgi:hypothetical protein